jgi:hypothetical protein
VIGDLEKNESCDLVRDKKRRARKDAGAGSRIAAFILARFALWFSRVLGVHFTTTVMRIHG